MKTERTKITRRGEAAARNLRYFKKILRRQKENQNLKCKIPAGFLSKNLSE